MRKFFQLLIAFFFIVSFVACTLDDNDNNDNDNNKQLIQFTATQESDAGNKASIGTKAVIASDGISINWESADNLSVFDGTSNNEFTLKSGDGSTSATFEGRAESVSNYTAIYPYDSNAKLEADGTISNVTLPAIQTATVNTFDKAAALMMAQSDGTTLSYKNAVGYVKVTPTFDCSMIKLSAADATTVLAGTAKMSYNGGFPTLDFSEADNKAYTITLKGNIKKNNSYYIAVPAGTLSAGWSISLVNADDSKMYTRNGSKTITFKRNTITNLGSFSEDGTWTSTMEKNGNVKASQQVDLGLTVTSGGKTYKVIFAKSNLTITGLAEKESAYGDYFAWGATETWYSSYTLSGTSLNISWKDKWSDGYVLANAPYYNAESSSYTKYTNKGDVLSKEEDIANIILGGDWTLPEDNIWVGLRDAAENGNIIWSSDGKTVIVTIDGIQGKKITKSDDISKYVFLPLAGRINVKSSQLVGQNGYYWSSTVYTETTTFLLLFNKEATIYPNATHERFYGYSIRPVRLVEVE